MAKPVSHIRLYTLFGSALLAVVLLVAMTSLLRAQEVTVAPAAADLGASTKAVDQPTALPGTVLNYTIVLTNSGDAVATGTHMTDTIPADVTVVAESLMIATTGTVTETAAMIDGNTVIWQGAIAPGSSVTVDFAVQVDGSAAAGTIITNSSDVVWSDGATTLSADTVVIAPDIFLPVIYAPLPIPTINTTRPNSSNAWTLSWNSVGSGFTYEVEESTSADFATATITAVAGTSLLVDKEPSKTNIYYHRVRSVSETGRSGWSNVVSVVSAYRDDFTTASNWGMRRTTNLDKVFNFYENGWMVVSVVDKWDWGIFSPMAPAPEVPYAFEYRGQAANLGNLLSHGPIIGADWTGAPCPDFSSLSGVYQHANCFNHFYNYNVILGNRADYADMKLLLESVGLLVWCPECGLSPMKRLSASGGNAALLERPLDTALSADGWNVYRIEVRETGLEYFVNGSSMAFINDTSWINDPYFGIFASTDEYNNSTWRIDYVLVEPLD